jgi:hypothetical protein
MHTHKQVLQADDRLSTGLQSGDLIVVVLHPIEGLSRNRVNACRALLERDNNAKTQIAATRRVP